MLSPNVGTFVRLGVGSYKREEGGFTAVGGRGFDAGAGWAALLRGGLLPFVLNLEATSLPFSGFALNGL